MIGALSPKQLFVLSLVVIAMIAALRCVILRPIILRPSILLTSVWLIQVTILRYFTALQKWWPDTILNLGFFIRSILRCRLLRVYQGEQGWIEGLRLRVVWRALYLIDGGNRSEIDLVIIILLLIILVGIRLACRLIRFVLLKSVHTCILIICQWVLSIFFLRWNSSVLWSYLGAVLGFWHLWLRVGRQTLILIIIKKLI